MEPMVARLEALAQDPGRKDLRWQLAMDDDLLDERIRYCELRNWLETLVRPAAARLRVTASQAQPLP